MIHVTYGYEMYMWHINFFASISYHTYVNNNNPVYHLNTVSLGKCLTQQLYNEMTSWLCSSLFVVPEVYYYNFFSIIRFVIHTALVNNDIVNFIKLLR